MDIKDFILIGGGILIVLVVVHGFWIAYRSKREPYRLDIVPALIPDDVDEMERLRGELPNGGARIKSGRNIDSELYGDSPSDSRDELQTTLDLGLHAGANTADTSKNTQERNRPDVKPRQAPARRANERFELEVQDEPSLTPIVSDERPRVAEIQLVTPERTRTTKPRSRTDSPRTRSSEYDHANDPKLEREQVSDSAAETDEPSLSSNVEELLIINVLAVKGQRFKGEDLINTLRRQGLRYGEMNIFHRVNPATKGKIYSVANVVEPGVFDLSDLDALQSPGMCFFLQLPGPDDATAAFDDMLNAAQQTAMDLGGELRDEQLSLLTGQTKEHMRQRIADFTRRKLSKRA